MVMVSPNGRVAPLRGPPAVAGHRAGCRTIRSAANASTAWLSGRLSGLPAVCVNCVASQVRCVSIDRPNTSCAAPGTTAVLVHHW